MDRTDKSADRLRSAAALLPQLEQAPSKLQAFIAAGGMIGDFGPAIGWRVRLFGFSATGTGGADQAVSNWFAQVRRKAEGL